MNVHSSTDSLAFVRVLGYRLSFSLGAPVVTVFVVLALVRIAPESNRAVPVSLPIRELRYNPEVL